MNAVRKLGAVLLWVLATVLGLIAVILCVTLILLPLGLPLLGLAVRMYGKGVRLMLPRHLVPSADEVAGDAKRGWRRLRRRARKSPPGKALRGSAKKTRKRVRVPGLS